MINLRVIVMLVAALGVSACVPGRAKQTTTVKTTTTGQELEDLQKAYDAGIISESEFKKQRKSILKG